MDSPFWPNEHPFLFELCPSSNCALSRSKLVICYCTPEFGCFIEPCDFNYATWASYDDLTICFDNRLFQNFSRDPLIWSDWKGMLELTCCPSSLSDDQKMRYLKFSQPPTPIRQFGVFVKINSSSDVSGLST